MAFSTDHIYAIVFKIWRIKRLRMFQDRIKPTLKDRVLDVGGYPATWTCVEPMVGSVDSLNIHEVAFRSEDFPGYQINTVVGNGCALDFDDQSYDIAFSNSVIEHVGPWENQVLFAKEIRRAGNGIWVQTPAYECPIEPHYMAFFMHWLPKPLQKKLMRYFTPWGLISKPSPAQIDEMVETTRLITRKEMEILFPDCEIYTERMLGIIPKSYVAIRLKSA